MIAHPNVRNHVLSVSTDTDDPLIFGPYTERKANELAALFNERIDESQFGYVHATARRIDNPQGIRAILREFGQG